MDRVAETHYFVQMLAQIYLPTHISPGGHLQIYYMKQKHMDSTLPWYQNVPAPSLPHILPISITNDSPHDTFLLAQACQTTKHQGANASIG